jgi:hypothetical protein
LKTAAKTETATGRPAQKEGRPAIWAIAVTAIVAILVSPLRLTAGTVEHYTGNEFEAKPGARLLIDLTLNVLIQPNTEYFFSDLESGGMTDTNPVYIAYVGHPLDNLPLRPDLYFETDAAGNIFEWQIPDDTSITHESNVGSYFRPGRNLDADQTGGSFVPGTWECISGCFVASSEAPEPSTSGLTLFAPALLWLVRKRIKPTFRI